MPVPHLEIRIVQRSKGSSAIAGAAYQAGEKLFSEYDQKMKNYLYKKEVVYTEVMLPTNAPPGYADRATLWNAAEEVEKQWNSQLARRFVVALPREAPTAMYPQMMQEYCQEHFVSKGMCCDFAIHDPDPPGHNPHCHIMLTMRAIDENGKWLPKSRKVYDLDENGERIRLPSGNWKSHKENTVDWNEQYHAEEWRHGWELVQNKYLELAGSPERVDMRSYERQGLDKIPTVHMGAAVCALERKGIETNIGNLNRDIKAANRKTEEVTERGAKYGARKIREGYHRHKLKPYRAAAKAEKAAFKANVEFQYQKLLQKNPQLAASNPLSRYWQKQQIKKQYAKAVRTGGVKSAKTAADHTQKATRKTAEFVTRHWKGVVLLIAALLLFIMTAAGVSSCSSLFSGLMNGVLGTSYTSEDSDLVAVENNYAAMENELQQRIDNIERDYPGYDEYRYDLDNIGHNPHALASYLTALLQSYTPQSAQAELERIFDMQYTLTLTEEVEIRYRTETSTDPETGETTTEQVPYEYYILHVSLTNRDITTIAPEVLTAEQLQMFRVYLETSGNKPLLFGGGSADTSASEDLSGVQFVNGTRPGNPQLVELAKGQVGNVGGAPYWSWYGFDSRVAWCACFVSWCYGQAGLSEPHFAACQSQGVPWFTSHGQWGARGYENIAPGDAIFFDWDLDGSADHVGLVIGTDGNRVYTVEGNSGDACKIKSYPLDYACIKGYGLMNWN